MTISEIVDRARRFARSTESAASDGVLLAMSKDAVRQFSKDVFGFPIEEYLTAEAVFNTNTSFRFRVLITGGTNALATTDVAITSTSRTGASGTTVAGDLQSTINTAIATGDVSITFTNFFFTIDTSSTTESTAIDIDAPDAESYLDARDLFGLTGSLDGSGGVFTGDFPVDCTMKATLAGTPISVKHVAWDGCPLENGPREIFVRPETSGDPAYYFIEGSTILLTPAPTQQKELYVMYKGIPDLSDMTSVASGTIPTAIPEQFHIGLAYWIASELLLESFEDNMRTGRLGQYQKIVQEYLVNYNNQNTALEPKPVRRLWYRVEE
ncbi:MAG: hypothetical protein PHQ35_11365 [Phycisphaerae bacterium]|nr:hypothetical protein [Phycisphaerae bacterium]